MSMRPIAIIDIDTTIANNDHRAVLLEKHCATCALPMGHEHRSICQSCGGTASVTPQEKWDQFLDPDLMIKDSPQPHAISVLENMRQKNWWLVFLTGRNEKHREVTEKWLDIHMLRRPQNEVVVMRPAHAHSVPASVMKEEMFLKWRADHGLELAPFMFFEDDRFVLGTWQKYGMVFLCPQAWEYMNPEVNDRTVVHEPAWNR